MTVSSFSILAMSQQNSKPTTHSLDGCASPLWIECLKALATGHAPITASSDWPPRRQVQKFIHRPTTHCRVTELTMTLVPELPQTISGPVAKTWIGAAGPRYLRRALRACRRGSRAGPRGLRHLRPPQNADREKITR